MPPKVLPSFFKFVFELAIFLELLQVIPVSQTLTFWKW